MSPLSLLTRYIKSTSTFGPDSPLNGRLAYIGSTGEQSQGEWDRLPLPLPEESQRDRIFGIPLQQLFEHRDTFLGAAGAEMNLGERHVRGLVLWALFQDALEETDRGIGLTLRHQYERQIGRGFSIIGATAQRLTKVTLR